MSIEDRLTDAARAVDEMWPDSDATQDRLAQLQARLADESSTEETPAPAAGRGSRTSEQPLDEDFLDVTQVAETLRVSKMTVYRLVHNGHLSAVRDGIGFRVPRASVLEYLGNLRQGSPARDIPGTGDDHGPPLPRPTRPNAYGRPAGERPLSEVNFLNVAQIAEIMRVSKMAVYRLVHSGHLPAIRVGRSFRVPEQAVYEYLHKSQDSQHAAGDS